MVWRTCGVAVLWGWVAAVGVWADGGPASRPAALDIPTVPYEDAAFGFAMHVPAGWAYDRTRFQEYEDSIGLLRGRAPDGHRALQIMVFRVQPEVIPRGAGQEDLVRLPTFEDWVIVFGKSLGELTGAERVSWETWNLPPRAGALLTYDTKLGAMATQTHTLCVPFDPSTVWVFVYSGRVATEADRVRLRRRFDGLAKTLAVHYDPSDVDAMGKAFERGRALLTRLRARAAEIRIDEGERYYELSIDGKSIGYLWRRMAREAHVFTSPGARHRVSEMGLRVRERSWRFAEDGTVRRTRLDMFSGFDLRNELIEYELTQFPAPDVAVQQPLVKMTQAIRKEDMLVCSYSTGLDPALPDPVRPIKVGPLYLDLAWLRLAPGLLLGGAEDAPHAFAVFDTETRALMPQTLTLLGRRELAGEKESYLFEVRAGLINEPALMYTDRRGNLIRYVAGDLVIMRSTREAVERAYGERREAVRRRFEE
jgi:hypothetical protein